MRIEILTKNKVWEHLIEIGDLIGKGWVKSADKFNLDLKVTDFKPLITFKLNYGDLNNKLITLFTQEMLKKGYLAAPSVYVSMSHTKDIVKNYLEDLDSVFETLAIAIENNTIDENLLSKSRSDSFSRLT